MPGQDGGLLSARQYALKLRGRLRLAVYKTSTKCG